MYLWITLCKTFTASAAGLDLQGVGGFWFIHRVLGIKRAESSLPRVENRCKAHRQALYSVLKNVRKKKTRVDII